MIIPVRVATLSIVAALAAIGQAAPASAQNAAEVARAQAEGAEPAAYVLPLAAALAHAVHEARVSASEEAA